MGCRQADRQQPLDRPTTGQMKPENVRFPAFLLVQNPVKSHLLRMNLYVLSPLFYDESLRPFPPDYG